MLPESCFLDELTKTEACKAFLKTSQKLKLHLFNDWVIKDFFFFDLKVALNSALFPEPQLPCEEGRCVVPAEAAQKFRSRVKKPHTLLWE